MPKLTKLTLLSILFLSSTLSYAGQKAQVLIMRGSVTKLPPGAQKAMPVKRGEWLLEDTSIVTGDKSFVKLKFEDRSTMNLGPRSKVVIDEMPSKKANVVNLLTGMIKAEVKKKSQKETKNKMLIKTRSAVMGVRGTKFQSIYNPVNKRTALVTIEGKVAMANKKELTDSSQLVKEDAVELEKVLDQSDAVVEVEAGRFSGVGAQKAGGESVALSKPTVPVKIAPDQYNALAKTMDSKLTAEDVMDGVDAEVAPEGFVDNTKGVAPKAGGLVDFTTGLYISPTKDAKLDEKTGTYKAEAIGKVDETSGDYIPPQGVKVDPAKGLVVDNEEIAKVASAQERQALLATVTEVNREVKKQGIEVNKIQSAKPDNSSWGWLPDNHLVAVEILPFSETLEVKNKVSGSKAEFYTDSALWVKLNWSQIWSSKITSLVSLGFQHYEVKEDDFKIETNDSDEDSSKHIHLGVGYRLNEKLKLKAALNFRDDFYVTPGFNDPAGGGDKTVNVDSYSTDFISLGAEYQVGELAGFNILLEGELITGESDMPSNGPDDESGDLSGFAFGASTGYSFSEKLNLRASAKYETREAVGENYEFDRSALGIGANLVYDI